MTERDVITELRSTNQEQTGISVVIITYGHERYIEEAITGVFMQKTDFPIELIISNDCSPDGTDAVVKRSLNEVPAHITVKYTNHQTNLGIMPNFIWALQQATQAYIALCEGDDYWTDPLKLQKQVDYLQSNKSYSLCFHSSQIKIESNDELAEEIPAGNRDYKADELVLTKVAHTASFVFRSFAFDHTAFNSKAIFGGDVMLALLLADQGKVYGMKEYMSVYRKHEGGVTNIPPTAMIAHQKRMMGQFLFMKKHIKSADPTAFQRKVFDHAITVAMLYKKQKNYGKTVLYLMKAVKYYPGILTKVILKPFKKLK